MVISALVDFPLGLYRTFKLEARFGFNRSTLATFFADLAKSAVLSVVLGAPLLFCILWLMAQMGERWWLYVWIAWAAFNLLMLLVYPTLIAPLFNKFTPLENASLRARIEALLTKCGFQSQGLYVMDSSKRSSHGNAYFTGFGRFRRIVLYDTLIAQLTPEELEAVLAHEIGHYRLGHIPRMLALSSVLTYQESDARIAYSPAWTSVTDASASDECPAMSSAVPAGMRSGASAGSVSGARLRYDDATARNRSRANA